MACGCQKNKVNTAANKVATRPSKPTNNGRVVNGSGRIEKRIIR